MMFYTFRELYPRLCLLNTVCDNKEIIAETVYTFDEQCQFYYGEDARFCPNAYVCRIVIILNSEYLRSPLK